MEREGIFIKMLKDFFKKDIVKKSITPILVIVFMALLIITVYSKRKVVSIVINGREKSVTTFRSTVGQVLKSKDIIVGSKDKVNPSLVTKIRDKDIINLKRAVNVTVTVDGSEHKILSAEDNILSMLNAEGISLRDRDKVIPDRSAGLSENMKIEIVRVDTKVFTEYVTMNFKEVVNTSKSLPNTKRQVKQEGKNGRKQVTVSVTYENGKEVARKITDEKIIEKPKDRIIVQGTYPYMPVSRGGQIMSYSKVFTARATAYWAVRGVGRTYTASGRKAVWNPDGYSTIAVDPKVIPYGTKVFVEGYGFAVAADTGTSIIGSKVDVYFNTYKQACAWGAKYVKVYVLK
jgi:uncharacterized protein YabE (DUF348 family)